MAIQKPANKKWRWIMALVVACLLAVGGWVLTRPGTNDAKTANSTLLKSIDANSVKPNEQGGNSQSRDLCGGTGGVGQIISVGSNIITIKRRKNGLTQIVNLTNQTIIKTSAGSASQSDLKIGDAVTLVGGPNSDGSFTADTVLVCGGISPKT